MRPNRFLSVVAAGALSLTLVAADEPDLVPVDETFFISAGCPQDTPGTCTSTRWLGKTSGSATSNFLTATTPADEALFRATGQVNWRDYPSDFSFEEYLLDVDRDLSATVTLRSSATAGVGANVTVHGRVQLRVRLADGTTKSTTLTAPDQVITAMTTLDGPVPVEFDFDLPESLRGATATGMTVEVAVHGVNAQSGYIDQQGGSPVTVPHLVPNA